jgi:hypothetical protein
MTSFIWALRILRWQLLVIVMFGGVIAFADQASEVFLILSEDPGRYLAPIIASFLLAIVLSFSIFFSGLILIADASQQPIFNSTCARSFATALLQAASIAPPVILALGILFSEPSYLATSVIAEHNHSTIGGVLMLLVAVIGFLTQMSFLRRVQANRPAQPLPVITHLQGGFTFVLACCTVAAVIVGAIFVPLRLGALLGPISVLALFCSCSVMLLALMALAYNRWQVPFISILLLCGCTWSFFGWNENHTIRTLPLGSRNPVMTLESAFGSWLGSRKDLEEFGDRSRAYPVYIVSTEGGGAYAGFHAAATLARLQDSCPRFAQHVFAISGVSGGSLGGAVFAASAKRLAKNEPSLSCNNLTTAVGPFQTIVERYFDNDFLTPVVAGALFPDFLQIFLPKAIRPFDRARMLETSFEVAWKRASPTTAKLFADSFRELWDASDASPALILNTTETASGIREFIAPFTVDMISFPQTYAHLGAMIDLPLSTAIGLSARFPWVTPGGTFMSDGVEYQLADGGYFENSGAETAHNLIIELKRKLAVHQSTRGSAADPGGLDKPDDNSFSVSVDGKLRRISIKLIVIHAENVPAFKTISGEILAPIQTMLSARSERGHAAVRLALISLCPQCRWDLVSTTDSVHIQTLAFRSHPIPLGWWLSRSSFARIFDDIGDNKRCTLGSSPSGTTAVPRGSLRDENDCLYEFVFRDLSK